MPGLAFFRGLLAAAGSLALSLVAAEYACRALEPEDVLRTEDSMHRFVDYDPVFGWSHLPGADGYFHVLGRRTEVHISAEGLRYHRLGAKNGPRVAVIGDSLVWGYGVNAEERFTDLLEKTQGVEMLNLGNIGYGPVQYLLLAEKALALQPDLVLLVFTLYNDFDDNVHNMTNEFYRPYAQGTDGALHIRGQPVPDYRKYTLLRRPDYTRYALGRLLYAALSNHARPLFDWLHGPDKAPPPAGRRDFAPAMLYAAPEDPVAQAVLAVNEAVLRALRDRLAAQGVKLLIFAAPTWQDVNGNTLRLLREQAQRLEIPLLAAEEFGRMPDTTYPDRIHWTPQGHRRIAESLAPALRRHLNLP